MPEDYTVKAVIDQKSWEGNYGRMIDYEVALDDLGETVTVTQKPETDPPSEGQVIYGHLEDGKFGKKLKKDQRDGAPQRSRNGSSQPSRDDATGRSIERQVAAKIAGELIGHEGYAALPDEQFGREFRKVTDAVHAAIAGTAPDEQIPFG